MQIFRLPSKNSETQQDVKSNSQIAPAAAGRKLRVAAYCRVSTRSEIQSGSLEMQSRHFRQCIKEHPDWVLVKVFEEQASGKNISGRPEFQKMLKLCRQGKIDIILTKSVQRFCRNTVDLLTTCRELRQLGVKVYFELENIWAGDSADELLLTICASLAQNESENLSEDIKWGLKRTFERGTSKVISRVCFGYRRDDDRELIIYEPEAEIVRQIFKWKIAGCSLSQISQKLSDKNIPTPNGGKCWSGETLNKILHNEKYTGNVLLGKTYVPDLLTGKQVRNRGQEGRYFIEHTHDAIISIEDFKKVGGWIPEDEVRSTVTAK